MKNNQLILLILSSCILLILSSCISTSQLHQDKTRLTTETSTHEITVSNNQVISNTKIIESQDTSVIVSGSNLISSAKFNHLLAGDTIFASGENLLIKTFYDSLNKTIKTQATVASRTIHINIDKITETSQVGTGSVITNKEEQKKQTIVSEKIDKHVQRSAFPAWLIILMIILFIGVIGFIILKVKKYL